ncbi:calcium/calmodulin-dependent protein kinase type II subunit delta-like [Ptychodera flava]|uniref:calcium/calmodulin-dependent protein kinase type II subunit delta-like n=1 Tax=Ptychodera flava TaxID=63121 RepID=UPI00396A5106
MAKSFRRESGQRLHQSPLRATYTFSAGVIISLLLLGVKTTKADEDPKEEIIRITKEMLHAIDHRDFNTYRNMTVNYLSCFEPQTKGQLVEGLDFHKYFFDRFPISDGPTTIVNPRVHLFGTDVACIGYVRLRQRMVGSTAEVLQTQETRVWQKINGQWKLIHFHRSDS